MMDRRLSLPVARREPFQTQTRKILRVRSSMTACPLSHITTIVRDHNSRTYEVVHPNHMPGFDVRPPLQPAFLGAESRFIPDPSVMSLMYGKGKEIFDLSKLATGQEKFIGYIYGGIEAQPAKSKNGYVYQDWKKYGQFKTTISPVVMKVYVTRNM
jgi:hypothetical protein